MLTWGATAYKGLGAMLVVDCACGLDRNKKWGGRAFNMAPDIF